MEEQSNDKDISTYNEAGLQIQRLHVLWIRAENYALSGKLAKWCWTLDSIRRELHADFLRQSDSKDLIKKDLKMFKMIMVSLSASNKNTTNGEPAYTDPDYNKKMNIYVLKEQERLKKAKQLYAGLSLRHMFLKEVQDLSGKGGIYAPANSEDFE